MILLTGCTTAPPPAPDPAATASVPQPAYSALTLRRAERGAARRKAIAAMRDYLQAGRSRHGWWAALKPHLSAGARQDYVGTDPATIGARRLTGPASVTPASLPALARVAVPTDAGRYLVLLSRSPGQQWAMARILVPEAVS